MVSICPVISKSPNPFNDPLVTVRRAPTTIGIIVTFMFHGSIAKQGPGTYPSFDFLSTLLCGQPGQQSPQFCKFAFFVDYYKIWSSGRDSVIGLYLKIIEEFMYLILWTDAGLCIYHLLVWSNLNFWHNSQWITLPTKSCLVLYSFCANLLNSFIMW